MVWAAGWPVFLCRRGWGAVLALVPGGAVAGAVVVGHGLPAGCCRELCICLFMKEMGKLPQPSPLYHFLRNEQALRLPNRQIVQPRRRAVQVEVEGVACG